MLEFDAVSESTRGLYVTHQLEQEAGCKWHTRNDDNAISVSLSLFNIRWKAIS